MTDKLKTTDSMMVRASRWTRRRAPLLLIFALFLFANTIYLHRVPGLLGDEGSEGQNVHELLTSDELPIRGERSYIGAALDYVRVPFVGLFGYSTLALRLPMLLASAAFFWLAASVLTRLFGEFTAPFALAAMTFSPAYLAYQRLGWAITLLPLFGMLTLYLLWYRSPRSPLLTGLAAGVGVSTHILFLPTLPALLFAWVVLQARRLKEAISWWPALVGFWAGFGMQFAILRTFLDDQGDPAAVAALFSDRLRDLPAVLPLVLSGSAFVAQYTGAAFSATTIKSVSVAIIALAVAALLFGRRRMSAWAWAAGLTVHLLSLTYIIKYFSLRYFVVSVLGMWALAGAGIGCLLELLLKRTPRALSAAPVFLALLLTGFTGWTLLLPYLRSGGSTGTFSLGNRTDEAAALVDLRPLLACVGSSGPVFSESIHIRNRFEYLEHGREDVTLAQSAADARWIITYRTAETLRRADEKCPDLRHFRVVPGKERTDTRR